jgi:hypothetical protein
MAPDSPMAAHRRVQLEGANALAAADALGTANVRSPLDALPPVSSPLKLSGSPRGEKLNYQERWALQNRAAVSAIAGGGAASDLYLAHLNMILTQVTFRLNMYKLSADFYDAKVCFLAACAR